MHNGTVKFTAGIKIYYQKILNKRIFGGNKITGKIK
jgi:hypothetical protein